VNYTYDDEGRLGTAGSASFTFDCDQRLIGIDTAQFFYDGRGNRLKAIRGGATTYYIYDPWGNLLAEADANGITRKYVYGNGLLALATSSDLYCYHFDATGNTIALTDMAQTVVNSYSYEPFGQVLAQQETVAQPFKFVGRFGVMAEPNGIYYMRARYYDPSVGRFISEDPLGFGGGDVNFFAYVLNDPVNWVDPTGNIRLPALNALSQKAVRLAWQMERQLVATGGRGTRRWTDKEAAQLLSEGKVCGYHGHHINSLAAKPEMAGDPANIAFKTLEEHFAEHGFNWQNPTSGEMINRTLRGAIIGITATALYGVASALDAVATAADYSDPVSAFLAVSAPVDAE